jgi:glycosyltransferase involved in cell wall biosynthesis
MTQIYPKISIITPSYNQGQFIEETILSVIGQNYPNLEYIIIDGGSTDNTVEIIKKYEKYLTYWVSEPDNGQAHAINKGFAIATGDILAWLNSDDMYMPNILSYVSDTLNIDKPELLFGNAIHIMEGRSHIFPNQHLDLHNKIGLEYVDYIVQPSSFWTRNTWELVGLLNENYHFVFDWEWFIKAQKKEVNFISTLKHLSIYRIHKSHKTGSGGDKRDTELLGIFSNYLSTEMSELSKYIYKNRSQIIKTKQRIELFRLWRFRKIILRLVYPKIYKHPEETIKAIGLMFGIVN